jgi:hypothetical protein
MTIGSADFTTATKEILLFSAIYFATQVSTKPASHAMIRIGVVVQRLSLFGANIMPFVFFTSSASH